MSHPERHQARLDRGSHPRPTNSAGGQPREDPFDERANAREPVVRCAARLVEVRVAPDLEHDRRDERHRPVRRVDGLGGLPVVVEEALGVDDQRTLLGRSERSSLAGSHAPQAPGPTTTEAQIVGRTLEGAANGSTPDVEPAAFDPLTPAEHLNAAGRTRAFGRRTLGCPVPRDPAARRCACSRTHVPCSPDARYLPS
jgi:hypothetical protein